MPGPCNLKKKQKSQLKKERRRIKQRQSIGSHSCASSPALVTPDPSPVGPPISVVSAERNFELLDNDHLAPKSLYIHDPGNGPRVRDTRTFLTSYFAQPPSLHDPLCAEFAQEEVLQVGSPPCHRCLYLNTFHPRCYAPFCQKKPHWYASFPSRTTSKASAFG